MGSYRRGAHTVYESHLRLVWTTKYRKAVLAGELALRLRDLIREICGDHDVKIMQGHVAKDHVHLLAPIPRFGRNPLPSARDSPCPGMMDPLMNTRGQIYFAELIPTRGREQVGRRPVLVVPSNAINRQPLVVAVVVGISAENIARDYLTNVRVPAAESGFPKDTVFLCFQVRSLDRARLSEARMGPLGTSRMHEVNRALRLSLDLE